MTREQELSDTLVVKDEPESSRVILEAIEDAERAFQGYDTYCRTVDRIYSLSLTSSTIGVHDETFALFWASMEILKPAIYAKPPKPIAAPRFKDGGNVEKTVSELIERCLTSVFDRGNIDEVMLGIRDDLALTNRGVAWVTYESEDGKQNVCIEHLDRADFLHEPARKWSEVGWVARRAWMTRSQMRKRFRPHSGEAFNKANFTDRKDKNEEYGMHDSSAKAGVWEVWHRSDNRVYWVNEDVKVILDEDEPHLNLDGFFPCPRPAYGTLQRRSLIPVPDYKRYAYHLDQINELTSRIYTLLEQVRLLGFIPAGGEIGDAITTALAAKDDIAIIPVPSAALGQGTNAVTWLPLDMVATTIQGLIQARTQLFDDFYQLSGISDIMRGATEAQETLGAQQLKSQYGSVRVRDKIDELARMARDIAAIAAEIISENYSQKTLLDLSRMTIPKKAEVTKKIKETQDAAEAAIKKVAEDAKEAADQAQGEGEQIDPQQGEQAIQQVVQQFHPILQELENTVVIEDVMAMLRDDHSRNLIIEIETDSTVLTDEMAEKQSRAEFLNAFSGASASIQPLLAAGESGAKLAGGILKFALQPYRANRELDALIDEFVDNAPNMPQPEGEDAGLAAAQMELARAELMKAQAQGENYQAQAALKAQELQLKGAEAQAKTEQDQQKFALSVQEAEGKIAQVGAGIQKIWAEIEAMGIRSQIDIARVENEGRKTDIEAARTVADAQARQVDQERAAVNDERSAAMGERQQTFTERQAEREPAE